MMNDAERTLACALLSAAVALAGACAARGAVLDVGFDEDVVVDVADGATRTQTEAVRQEGASHIIKTGGVKYAGRSYSGTLTAERCPFLLGPGSLEVTPKGTVLLFR